jgi:hypothetical protein
MPDVFVELGVHYGDSYFAFCQAVKQFKSKTECIGIDNWQGDEQSGFYDDNVFQAVEKYNTKNYQNFSKLVRNDFDTALADFADQSIDILHLDGCHKEENIIHDFSNWIPKVKENGFILIHDIAINREDFGAYKFWHDVKTKYTSYEFFHSCGLGILCKNKKEDLLIGDINFKKLDRDIKDHYLYNSLRVSLYTNATNQHII